MRRFVCALAVLAAAGANASATPAQPWPFVGTNTVASSPATGGGYPDPDGTPAPGTCTTGSFNSNRSESWIANDPGTENLGGTSKFFFDLYSTFYNFYLGSYDSRRHAGREQPGAGLRLHLDRYAGDAA